MMDLLTFPTYRAFFLMTLLSTFLGCWAFVGARMARRRLYAWKAKVWDQEEEAPPTRSTIETYRSADEEDPEAPKGILSNDPTGDEQFLVDTAQWAIRAHCNVRTSDGRTLGAPSGSRNGKKFTMGYNDELSLWVYKADVVITSPNFVAFLRRVREHERTHRHAKK